MTGPHDPQQNINKDQPFNEDYFSSGTYANVSFGRFSQYWWSNRFYARLARRYGPRSGKVLEIGCGLGHLLAWLTDRYEVFGSDINAWALEQARRNVPQGHFLELSAEDLGAFSDATFQIVIAKHVVEHLPHPEKAIAEAARVMAPGGLLILATPNLDSPMRAVKKGNWIGYRDHTHISLKPAAEWLELLRRNHLRTRKVFSDGFWDAPYLPALPARLQKLILGAPGGLQAISGICFVPLSMGESMIAIVEKA